MESIKEGQIWKHYKGSIYEIMGFATHSETGEPMVLYRRADMTDPRWWARPQAMWFNIVMVDSNENIKDRRFTLIKDCEGNKVFKKNVKRSEDIAKVFHKTCECLAHLKITHIVKERLDKDMKEIECPICKRILLCPAGRVIKVEDEKEARGLR